MPRQGTLADRSEEVRHFRRDFQRGSYIRSEGSQQGVNCHPETAAHSLRHYVLHPIYFSSRSPAWPAPLCRPLNYWAVVGDQHVLVRLVWASIEIPNEPALLLGERTQNGLSQADPGLD